MTTTFQIQLFEGERVRFAAPDPDKDAPVESRWTHDPDYLRALSADTVRPLSPAQVKKKYESLEKEAKEGKNLFYFHIRAKDDDRLLGFVKLFGIEWTHQIGRIQMGIGEANDRGKGHGTEALRLALRYAFHELNLYRLGTLPIPGYNTRALQFFARHGFVEEVRRRQAILRNGERWDAVLVGVLREEWAPGVKRHGPRSEAEWGDA
jgi:RimJ/RimL family protein N-acetyltransferase